MKRRRLIELIGATLMIALTAFAGISCTKDGPAKLEGVTWVLKAYGEPGNLTAAVTDKDATLMLDRGEGTLGGNSGVNSYGGNYEADGNKLIVSDLVSTKIAGPPPLQNQENRFFNILRSAQSYEIVGGELTITGTEGVLVFNIRL